MLNCIIVDDEKPARDELNYILTHKCEGLKVVAEASNAIEAMSILNEREDIDLLFLDIKMPEITGIDFAKILLEKKIDVKIIFVTAYDEFAIKAFRVNAIDYILKPIDENILRESLKNKVFKNTEEDEGQNLKELEKLIKYMDKRSKKVEKLTVYYKNKMVPLDYIDIIYITVENKETYIYTKDRKYYISSTLNNLMKELDNNIFFRSHKSFIINLEQIESIEEWFNSTLKLKMKNIKDKIPVSRTNVREFKDIMNVH